MKVADARRLAREAREAISKGRDPVEERRAAKAKLLADAGRLMAFEQSCRDYLAAHQSTWKHPAHARAWTYTLLEVACAGMPCGKAGDGVAAPSRVSAIGELATGLSCR